MLKSNSEEKHQAQSQFALIGRLLFPRWKAAKDWEIVVCPQKLGPCAGFCDTENKRILLRKNDTLTIIHEVCHAVTKGGHGLRWQNRMESVAKYFEQKGDSTSATHVRDEIAKFEQEHRLYEARAK